MTLITARFMTVDLIQLLNDTGATLIQQIKAAMSSTGTDATLKTSNSLEYTVDEQEGKLTLSLIGRPYFTTVETGRQPTPDKKPSRAMIDNIREWVTARGLEQNMVWAIAVTIQKEGTKLWQIGGRKDIYTQTSDTMVVTIQKAVLEAYALAFSKEVIQLFKK